MDVLNKGQTGSFFWRSVCLVARYLRNVPCQAGPANALSCFCSVVAEWAVFDSNVAPPLPRFEVGLLDFVPKSTPCTAGTPLEQHNAGQKHASPAIEALFFLNKLPRTPSPFFSSG